MHAVYDRVRTLAEEPTVVRRAELRAADVPGWLADTYAQIEGYLQPTGTAMSGPPFARYEFRGNAIDVEAGFPVTEPVTGDSEIKPSTLPGGAVAVTTHYGRYEMVEDAYKAILTWLQRHSCEPAGRHWELYLSGPAQEPDPTRWRTDVVVPYRQAGR